MSLRTQISAERMALSVPSIDTWADTWQAIKAEGVRRWPCVPRVRQVAASVPQMSVGLCRGLPSLPNVPELPPTHPIFEAEMVAKNILN